MNRDSKTTALRKFDKQIEKEQVGHYVGSAGDDDDDDDNGDSDNSFESDRPFFFFALVDHVINT